MSSAKLRRGRYSVALATYAVTVVLRHRDPLFVRDPVAVATRECLRMCDKEGISRTHAWVLMPDHLHWLFELREGSLSRCLCRFKSRSASAVNQLLNTHGPVWQPGFYDHRVRVEEDIRRQARYIIANPIRACLVTELHEYPHWGCRWIAHDNDSDAS